MVLDRASAERGDLAVGDRTTLRTPTPVDVTVVGTATFGTIDGMNGATYVGTSPELAAEILGRPGEVTAFLLRAEPGTSAEALRTAVAEVLPSQAEALTGAEAADEDLAAAKSDFIDLSKQILLAFALVALVVAAFTIHNTFTIVMAQRSRETALARAIGASAPRCWPRCSSRPWPSRWWRPSPAWRWGWSWLLACASCWRASGWSSPAPAWSSRARPWPSPSAWPW